MLETYFDPLPAQHVNVGRLSGKSAVGVVNHRVKKI